MNRVACVPATTVTTAQVSHITGVCVWHEAAQVQCFEAPRPLADGSRIQHDASGDPQRLVAAGSRSVSNVNETARLKEHEQSKTLAVTYLGGWYRE